MQVAGNWTTDPVRNNLAGSWCTLGSSRPFSGLTFNRFFRFPHKGLELRIYINGIILRSKEAMILSILEIDLTEYFM